MKYLIIIIYLIPSIILGGTLDMSFYGDIQRWWVGTVEEGSGQSDPNMLGRCKVRIDGIHGSDISLDDLPYAQCILPTTGGGTSGVGENPQLLPGAKVIGFFLDGAMSQLPVVWGFLPHSLGPSGIQRQNIALQRKAITQVLETNKFQQRPVYIAGNTSSASSSSTSSASSTSGLSNIEQAWKFFENNGRIKFQDYHIAGMIGNFMVESGNGTIAGGINPKSLNPTAEASEGIAQWNPGGAGKRLQHLKAFASAPTMQGDYQDLLVQLSWVVEELINEPYHNNKFVSSTKTVTQAALHFMRNYEIPAATKNKTKIFTAAQGGRFRGNIDLEVRSEGKRIKAAKAVYIKCTQKPKDGI